MWEGAECLTPSPNTTACQNISCKEWVVTAMLAHVRLTRDDVGNMEGEEGEGVTRKAHFLKTSGGGIGTLRSTQV